MRPAHWHSVGCAEEARTSAGSRQGAEPIGDGQPRKQVQQVIARVRLACGVWDHTPFPKCAGTQRVAEAGVGVAGIGGRGYNNEYEYEYVRGHKGVQLPRPSTIRLRWAADAPAGGTNALAV